MSRFTLADLPPKYAAQVYAQTKPKSTSPLSLIPKLDKVPPMPPKTSKNRIRQNSAGLNKTEQAFFDWLKSNPCVEVLSQSITLRIGNGVRYTPDFVTITEGNRVSLWAYEVKGFMRDDAAVKLKVAASLYPWIQFHLVTRKKGDWQIQVVLP